MKCRLCQSDHCVFFAEEATRKYLRCTSCSLIFVPEEDLLSIEEEKTRYALHDNSINNKDYVKYLSGFAEEVKRIPLSNPEILDFGCGDETVLSKILAGKGFNCSPYDPLYDIGKISLSKSYDIIILCEVIEHIRDISREISLLKNLLNKNGYILIKTELYNETESFTDWWYTKDPTHINFFSFQSTMLFGELLGTEIYYTNHNNIIILQ